MTIEYTEITANGTARNVTEEELKERAERKWFTWLFQVGQIVGWSREETADRVNDVSWFGCFDDGMTPKQAVAEAKNKGVI